MDYGLPYRTRTTLRRQLCVLLIAGSVLGLLWSLSRAASFVLLRARSVSMDAVVLGYEVAGGKQRLRVQTAQAGKPRSFMLLDVEPGTPRYTEGQRIQLLSRPVTNSFGHRLETTVPYAHRNYWRRPVIIALGSGAALALGLAGLRRLQRANEVGSDPSVT